MDPSLEEDVTPPPEPIYARPRRSRQQHQCFLANCHKEQQLEHCSSHTLEAHPISCSQEDTVVPPSMESTCERPARSFGSGSHQCSHVSREPHDSAADDCKHSSQEQKASAKSASSKDAMQAVTQPKNVDECHPRISISSKAACCLQQDVDCLWQELHRTRADLSAACLTPERVVRVVEVANAGLQKRLEEFESNLGEALGMHRGFADTLGGMQTHVEGVTDGMLNIQRKLAGMEQCVSSDEASVSGPSVRTADMSVEIAGDCAKGVTQKLYSTTLELRAEAVAQSASLESRVVSAEAIFNAGLKHIRGVVSTCMADMANLQPRVADLERALSLMPVAAPVPQTHVTRGLSASFSGSEVLGAAEAAQTTIKCTGGTGAASSRPNCGVAMQQQAATSQQPQLRQNEQQHQQQQQTMAPITQTRATAPTLMGACGPASGVSSSTCPGPLEAAAQQASNRSLRSPSSPTLAGGSRANVTHSASAVELGLAALAQKGLHTKEIARSAAPIGSATRMLDDIARVGAAVGCRNADSQVLEAPQGLHSMCSTYSRAMHQQLRPPEETQKQQRQQQQQPASILRLSTLHHSPRTPDSQTCRDLLALGTRGLRESRSSLPPWLGSPLFESRGLKHEKEQQTMVRSRSGYIVEANCHKEDIQGMRNAPHVPEPRDESPVRKSMPTWSTLSSARSANSLSGALAPPGGNALFLAQVSAHKSPQMQKRDVTPIAWHSLTSAPQMIRR